MVVVCDLCRAQSALIGAVGSAELASSQPLSRTRRALFPKTAPSSPSSGCHDALGAHPYIVGASRYCRTWLRLSPATPGGAVEAARRSHRSPRFVWSRPRSRCSQSLSVGGGVRRLNLSLRRDLRSGIRADEARAAAVARRSPYRGDPRAVPIFVDRGERQYALRPGALAALPSADRWPRLHAV
jgi:hypothetical protein